MESFLKDLRIQPINNNVLKPIFIGVVAGALLLGCASKEKPIAEAPISPAQPSYDTLNQGLSYVRTHPPADEGEQIQRFLWLDQWVKVLHEKNHLTPEMAQAYWEDLTQFIKEPPVSISGLRKLSERATSRLGKNVALYQLYQAQLKTSSIEDAMKHLTLIEDDGASDLDAKAQELLELTKSSTSGESKKIGVLLPLSGDLRAFGQEALNAIQVAATSAYAEGIEFAVQDTGTSESQLSEALNRLIQEEKVTAIIGPLTGKETEFVFERAEVAKVPVISLATKESVEAVGQYGFRSLLTIEDQVKAMARFIESDLGAKRVAILYPDSAYGWDVVDLAKPAFEDRGLKISQMQMYASGATDFKDQLRRMTRLDQPKVRKSELCPKDPKEGPALPGCVKKSQDLKPLIDFEVLFVPDFADTVGLLLPTLPYVQLYGVQVVGLSGYNSSKLIERGGEAAEGVVFTDGYLSSSSNFPTRFFKERYKKLAGKEASRLAAEAFDVGMLSVSILKSEVKGLSRDDFADRLKDVRRFPGVTGELYSDDHRIKKTPKLLIVRDGVIRELAKKD